MTASNARRSASDGVMAELADVLVESKAQAENLLAALEAERDALRAGDVDAIHTAVGHKHDCVATLESLDGERLRLCTAADLPADLSTDARLGHQWKDYLAALELCRDADLVNARVTQVRRRHVEQALGILRGGHSQSAPVYGPAGRPEVASSNELGQA